MLIQGLQKLTLLDFPGQIACTVFTGGCNMRCPFCHNGALALGQGDLNISTEELLAFLDSRAGRLEGVCISGGEPTLHPDLPELIREIKNRGFKVKLDTNGTNPEMLLSLINDGLLDYVAMDVKNSPEKYLLTAGIGADFCRGEHRSSVKCRMQNAECRISLLQRENGDHEVVDEVSVGSNVGNQAAVSEEPLLAGEVAPQATERLLSKEKNGVYPPIMEKIKHSCDILRRGLVDFEFRTTLMRELHGEEDIRSIGRWLSGDEKYFLQTYRDEGDLLVGGFTAYTPEETRRLLAILREYIPNAEIR